MTTQSNALAGYKARVLVTGSPAVSFSQQATTANLTRTEYRITDASKRIWDRLNPMTVETSPNGTTWSAATGYTCEHAHGTVKFNTAQPAGTQVRVGGKYLTAAAISEAKDWTLNIQTDMVDVSYLGEAFKRQLACLQGGSASINKNWINGSLLDLIKNGNAMVVELYLDYPTGAVYSFYAYMSKDSIANAHNGVVGEALEYIADGQIYLDLA